jgi:uncharacterized membrane protein
MTDEAAAALAQAIADALTGSGIIIGNSISGTFTGGLDSFFMLGLLVAVTGFALWKRHIFLDIIAGLGWLLYSFSHFDYTSIQGILPFIVMLLLGIFMFIRVIEDTGTQRG